MTEVVTLEMCHLRTITLLTGIFISCSQPDKAQTKSSLIESPFIVVLGVAQDAGYPQNRMLQATLHASLE